MIADGRGIEATPGPKVVIASRQFTAVNCFPDEEEAVSAVTGCEQRNGVVAFRPATTPLRGGVSGCKGSPG